MENKVSREDERILKTSSLDSATSAYLQRQLTYIRAQALQVTKAPLDAFRVFPVTTDVPAGANTAVQRIYDSVGMAEIVSDYGDDLKRVDIVAQELPVKVVTVANAYSYSITEIQNAAFANVPLEVYRATAARRAIDAKLNKMAWFGDDAHGVVGFLNNKNITEYALPSDGKDSSTKLADKSEDAVLRDVNGLIETVAEQTKQVEQANTVLLAPKAYAHLATTRLANSDRSQLEFLENVHPEITRWMKVGELEGADNGKDMMVAGNFIPEYIKFEIPQRFVQYPVQPKNLEFSVPCVSRTIGVTVNMPLAFVKASGC